MVYQELIWTLQQYGAFNVFLPFILIFTVTFAILEKIGILGEKRFNIGVAMVLAFTVVGAHVLGWYPPLVANAHFPCAVALWK
jgi:hypothetical protein